MVKIGIQESLKNAVQPEKMMHSIMVIDSTLVRLHINALCDPISNPTIEKLLLAWITLTDSDVTLALKLL
ncbi:hypothetical protein [Acinetobacter seifertii]|uniref:hypothetical protein n=1 Tax=Acinetobacter seifertii TaxID=1530123 RepID=UPI00404312EB